MKSFFFNNRTGTPPISSYEVLRQIEDKNAKIRIILVLLLGLIFGILIFLLFENYNIQKNNRALLTSGTSIIKQQKQTLENIDALNTEEKSQINDLQRHIDCIVSLFTEPDRFRASIFSKVCFCCLIID